MRPTPTHSLPPHARRAAPLALLLALAWPAAAPAQFQPLRLRLPAPPDAEVVAARLSGLDGDDLLVTQPPGPIYQRYCWHGDLVTERAGPSGAPVQGGYLATGRFEQAAAGAPEDLLWSTPDGLAVRWGASPGSWQVLSGLFPQLQSPSGVAGARLLPRPEAVAVVPLGGRVVTAVQAYDLAAARTGGATPGLSWTVPPFDPAVDGDEDAHAFPVRVSPAAVAAGVDDVVVPFKQGFFALWHRSAPGGPSLAETDLVGAVAGARSVPAFQPWLPAGQADQGSIFGVAALDADGDGDPDLVFTYAHPSGPAGPPDLRGGLFYARNDGTAASLTTPPWQTLMGRPDLAGVIDPLTTRQLALDPPVLAVFDRFLGQILLLRGDARVGFTIRALPADGATPHELLVADLVGSPAPDLVVLTEDPDELWIYPDDGGPAPSVAFSPAPPTEALRGQDLPLAVTVTDPNPPVTVTWMTGDRLSLPAAAGRSWTVPGSLLCQTAGPLVVTARATDDLGVFAEATADVTVVSRPSLRLAGTPADRLVLQPGGASGEAEGSAWPACGRTATFAWGEVGLPGLVEVEVIAGAATSRRRFAVPEASYPAALAGQPSLTLQATDDLGATGTATLPVPLDAEGLTEVEVMVDRTSLGRGDLAVATARLRSRLGVTLPGVRARVRLAGLALAGAVTAEGAAASPGGDGAEVILDALPPAGAEVRLAVPVRGLGRAGEIAVDLLSSGGHRLSPAQPAVEARDPVAGCGCGAGGDPAGLALWAVALLGLTGRRRRSGRPPAT